jgi:ATP phosphoribosyltransferase regulatory subunit
LQFGAEIYGHAGLEADLEAIELALDSLHIVGVKSVILDVADVRVVNALVQGLNLSPEVMADLHTALSVKDSTWLQKLTLDMPDAARKALAVLPSLYGDASVLEEAERVLPSSPLIAAVRSSHSVVSNGLSASTGQKVGWSSIATLPAVWPPPAPAEASWLPASVADASIAAMVGLLTVLGNGNGR